MGLVYKSFHMLLLYYPSLLFILYIYARFGIPLKNGIFQREDHFSIRIFFEISSIGHILLNVIKDWKRGGVQR